MTSVLPFFDAFSHTSGECEDFGVPCVMRPALLRGTSVRYLRPLERGALLDLGYTITSTKDECWLAGIADLGQNLFDTSLAGVTSSGSGSVSSCSGTTFGPDIWLQFTASACGTVTVSQCASSSMSLAIAAFSTCNLMTGTPLACGSSSISFSATTGSSVVLRVAGLNSAAGPGCVQISIDSSSSCPSCSAVPNLPVPAALTAALSNPGVLLVQQYLPCSFPFTLKSVSVSWASGNLGTSTSDSVSIFVWEGTDLSRASPSSDSLTLRQAINSKYVVAVVVHCGLDL